MPKATTLTETNLIEQEINPTDAFPTTHINGITKTNDEWCKAVRDAEKFGERVEELEKVRDTFSQMYDNEVQRRYVLGKENLDLEKHNSNLRGVAANAVDREKWLWRVNEDRKRENATIQRQLDQTLEKVEELHKEQREAQENYEEALRELVQMESKFDDLRHLVLELSKDRAKLPDESESWTHHQQLELIEVVDQFLQDAGSIK